MGLAVQASALRAKPFKQMTCVMKGESRRVAREFCCDQKRSYRAVGAAEHAARLE